MGVCHPVTLSTGVALGFIPEEAKALVLKEKRRLKYQRRMSRQRAWALKKHTPTGKNYEKQKARIADTSANMANIRINMAHRISKTIAASPIEVVVCEKLSIKNMTKHPKAKQDPVTRQWLRNNARAKAWLNKSILNANWGRIINYLEYKLQALDKLLVKIPPRCSSKECFECGYIAKANRITQAKFFCQACGYRNHADHNAALVLKKRFLTKLNADNLVIPTKTVKRISLRKLSPERRSKSVEL